MTALGWFVLGAIGGGVWMYFGARMRLRSLKARLERALAAKEEIAEARDYWMTAFSETSRKLKCITNPHPFGHPVEHWVTDEKTLIANLTSFATSDLDELQ